MTLNNAKDARHFGPAHEGQVLDAQEWDCPACGASLVNAGAVLSIAIWDGTLVPVMVHDVCRRELARVDGLFLKLAEQVAKVEPTASAERAKAALEGAANPKPKA